MPDGTVMLMRADLPRHPDFGVPVTIDGEMKAVAPREIIQRVTTCCSAASATPDPTTKSPFYLGFSGLGAEADLAKIGTAVAGDTTQLINGFWERR
jgi:hypothetical protein